MATPRKKKTAAVAASPVSELLARVARKLTIETQLKQLYAEQDAIDTTLIAAVQASPKGSIDLGNGSSIALLDNFVDRATQRPKNVAFKTTAIRRYEIVVR